MLGQADRAEALAQIDAYLAEAETLLERARECEDSLRSFGVCEGHQLMAAQVVRAMQRLQITIQGSRHVLAVAPSSSAPASVTGKPRPWWARLLPSRPGLAFVNDLGNEGLS